MADSIEDLGLSLGGDGMAVDGGDSGSAPVVQQGETGGGGGEPVVQMAVAVAGGGESNLDLSGGGESILDLSGGGGATWSAVATTRVVWAEMTQNHLERKRDGREVFAHEVVGRVTRHRRHKRFYARLWVPKALDPEAPCTGAV
ncbi:hypothetical protein V2J09_005840 [Rumex salicifolius]